MWLVKRRDWYSGVRAIGPEYGRLYRFGLINYVYYACKLRGLSAFSGVQDSLLRCVGGVGEAGAKPLISINDLTVIQSCSLIPFPDVRYTIFTKFGSTNNLQLPL